MIQVTSHACHGHGHGTPQKSLCLARRHVRAHAVTWCSCSAVASLVWVCMFIFASCGCFIVGVDAGIGKGLDEQINQQVLQMQAKPLAEKLAKQDVFVEQLIAKAQMGLGEQMGDGEITDEQVDRLVLVYAVAMVQQQPKQAQEMLDMSDEELANELGEGLMKTKA